MRAPKLKWQKTADAFVHVFDALEAVAGALQGYDPRTTGEVVRKLADARKAVASLTEHISEAEECEMELKEGSTGNGA